MWVTLWMSWLLGGGELPTSEMLGGVAIGAAAPEGPLGEAIVAMGKNLQDCSRASCLLRGWKLQRALVIVCGGVWRGCRGRCG